MRVLLHMKYALGKRTWEERWFPSIRKYSELADAQSEYMQRFWMQNPDGPIRVWSGKYRIIPSFVRKALR